MDNYTKLKQELQETKDKILCIEKELQATPRVNNIQFRDDELCFLYQYHDKLVMIPSKTPNDTDTKKMIEKLSYEDKLDIIAYHNSHNSYWLMYITNYLVRELGYKLKLTSCLNSFELTKKSDN